jgi:hypothetical protein
VLGVFVVSKHITKEKLINKSPDAPVEGVYRYELIPAENPMDYYIDLWYQFGMGDDPKKLLNTMDDVVYLKEGDRVEINPEGEVYIKKKQRHLKLVVTNEP